MSELEELEKLIEQLRNKMHKVAENKAYTDPEVVKVSQELDILLVKYQKLCKWQARDSDK